MMSEEDRIKVPLYLEFNEKYFAKRNEKKVIELNQQEASEFFRSQRKDIEEGYEKIRYNLDSKTRDKKIDTSKTTKKQGKSISNIVKISDYLNKKA